MAQVTSPLSWYVRRVGRFLVVGRWPCVAIRLELLQDGDVGDSLAVINRKYKFIHHAITLTIGMTRVMRSLFDAAGRSKWAWSALPPRLNLVV